MIGCAALGVGVVVTWIIGFVHDSRCRQRRSELRRFQWEADHPEVAALYR